MLPDIYRRIVSAKYVLVRAIQVQNENNEMSISISLLLLHDAIELLMLAVLDNLQVSSKPKRDFMDFWSEIKNAGYAEPPDQIPMQSLNKLRVGLKHNGNLPNPQQVRFLVPRTVSFFDNVLAAYCGTSYENVSLIDLIPDSEVRDTIKDSRTKFLAGDITNSLIDLKVALHKIDNPDGKILPKLRAPGKPSLSRDLNRAVGPYLNELHSFLDQTATRTNAIMFGIDPIRYNKFLSSTPSLIWTYVGTYQAQLFRTYDDLSIEQYEELSLFLIDYALRVSEAYLPRNPK